MLCHLVFSGAPGGDVTSNEIWNNMMLYEMNLDIQYIYNTYCIATTVGWLISIEHNKTKQHGKDDIHGMVQSCTHFRRCYQVINCCVVLTLRFTCTMILNDTIWYFGSKIQKSSSFQWVQMPTFIPSLLRQRVSVGRPEHLQKPNKCWASWRFAPRNWMKLKYKQIN